MMYGTITHDGVGNKIICINENCQSQEFADVMEFPYAICLSCGNGGVTK